MVCLGDYYCHHCVLVKYKILSPIVEKDYISIPSNLKMIGIKKI